MQKFLFQNPIQMQIRKLTVFNQILFESKIVSSLLGYM